MDDLWREPGLWLVAGNVAGFVLVAWLLAIA